MTTIRIEPITTVDVDPDRLGVAISNMNSLEQARVFIAFSQGMRDFGDLEWRMQSSHIAAPMHDAAERHLVDEVLGEILAQIHIMDDRDEDRRG